MFSAKSLIHLQSFLILFCLICSQLLLSLQAGSVFLSFRFSHNFMIRCSFSAFISKIDTIAYLTSTFDPLGSLSRTEYDFKTTNELVKKLSLSHKMKESTRENLFKKGILGSALNDAGHYQGGATSLGGCTPPRTGSSSVGGR